MTNGSGNMTPAQRDAAQAELTTTRERLVAAKALLDNSDYFNGLSAEEKSQATTKSLELGDTILELENAQIGAIVADAETNLASLKSANDELNEAPQDLADFNRLLTAIGGVLGLAVKFIAPV